MSAGMKRQQIAWRAYNALLLTIQTRIRNNLACKNYFAND